jgi:hypothetical protein
VWFALALVVCKSFSQSVEESIVRVESSIGGKSFEGIGFAWQPPNSQQTYIVTALHLVAGSSKITIKSPGEAKLTDAKLYKFFRTADLALLAPTGPLKIPGLPIYGGTSSATGQVWGISKQRVVSRQIELGEKKPLITKLFERERSPKMGQLPPLTESDVFKHFSPHNYPGKIDVLSLSSPVREGDSGSPITVDGQAISMVDGGLENLGGIKKAWWSIPLKKNLEVLWVQGETDPSKIQAYTGTNGRILFSKPRSENKPVAYKGNEGTKEFSLYHTDQATFGEVYQTMLPEDRWYIEEAINDDPDMSMKELSPELIDVYEDYETGATFAIPTILSDDLEIEHDAGQTYVEAFSQFSEHSRSFVKLIVFIDHNGLKAKDSFKQYILSGDALNDDDWGGQNWQDVHWVKDNNSDDNVIDDLDDPHEPYYHEILERSYKKNKDDGEVFASMTINENGDFLGVAIIVNDPSTLEGDDLINYYLMEACMTMAGFPYD